ncbi:carbohydrate-binding family 9-like protein [Streptococcus pacificus]|uniref:Carbohydrate-binding family 9-like protein n=1 Tax=Streptococcus pacificus TaxID=2740577 RepID=A0ABS0ZIJ4_9STRE|nr:carbohydrate-binding family 9-like protein [Streptococcus pacificus]MBJ8325835.1 carbohydrate-binding family 9-like protein [Streptococcus pacificus]
MKKLSKHWLYLVMISFLSLALFGCTTSSTTSDEKVNQTVIAYNEATTPHYDVVMRKEKPQIDGMLDDTVWQDVPILSGGFHFPWDAKEAPLTEFKAFQDGTDLYFNFNVLDKDVLLDSEWQDNESTVDNEDRVELFFAGGSIDKPTPDGMPLYYAIEVDADGRVHDYSIEYYRDFDGEWDLEGLETAATKTDNGYSVEGKIPIKTLEELKLLTNNTMKVGAYRAEFSTPETEGDDPIMEWISWVDPKTPAPDFHVNSSFGEFRFLN